MVCFFIVACESFRYVFYTAYVYALPSHAANLFTFIDGL